VVRTKSHLGVAFDGDADRVGFVDEIGVPVPSDIIGALLCRRILKKNPGATIVCDVRCSKAVPNEITRLGGTSIREKVGHSNIRSRMRKEQAVFGIELSGHFFFQESFYSEGGPLPVFLIMELLMEEGKTLSQLVAEVNTEYHSGEINSTVTRPVSSIYADICAHFPTISPRYVDGLSLEGADWWCNVRPSANDPVVRLNLEATTRERMAEKRDEVLAIIRG
jgi:phosphomannomutase